MKVKMAKLIMCLFTLLPVKKIIVFESFFGKQFSDSPKAIHKFLLENKNEYPYRLIWAVKPGYEDEFIKQNIETVKRGSFKWLVLMARASYWVNNVRVPDWVVKNKKNNISSNLAWNTFEKIRIGYREINYAWNRSSDLPQNVGIRYE
ncbi:teichoic acid biosynthesis protein [Brochothrix thermosphacta DSM 20171 = FSL F6-1036]|nr:teichoic acid biosynthesis protein [Brochothrix thermosphacta DSM 20171 = FSL F6-1036]